jgi:hypothetical protein
LLKTELVRNEPKLEPTITQERLRQWARVADRMMKKNEATESEIADMILWVQADDFWMGNICSMSKLREQFPQLRLKRKAKNGPNGRTNGEAFKLPADYESPSAKLRRQQTQTRTREVAAS